MEFSRHVTVSIAAYFTYSYKFKDFDEYKNVLKKIISTRTDPEKEDYMKNCLLSTNEQLLNLLEPLTDDAREMARVDAVRTINFSFLNVFDTYYETNTNVYTDERKHVFYMSPSLVDHAFGFNHSIEYDNIEEDNSLDFTKKPMTLSQDFIDVIEENDLQYIVDGLKFYSNISERHEFD